MIGFLKAGHMLLPLTTLYQSTVYTSTVVAYFSLHVLHTTTVSAYVTRHTMVASTENAATTLGHKTWEGWIYS